MIHVEDGLTLISFSNLKLVIKSLSLIFLLGSSVFLPFLLGGGLFQPYTLDIFLRAINERFLWISWL